MDIVNACSLNTDHSYFKQCSEIHSKEIPDGFLPTLGLDFLSSLYHSFSRSKHSFLLLAIEKNKVQGFIAISLNTKNFFKYYLKTKIYWDVFQIPLKIFGRVFLTKCLDLLKYPFSKKDEEESFISNSEIFNFCVDSMEQGKGVGQALFSNAMEQLKNNQVSMVKIVTGQSQISAQNFYFKSGAVLSHKIRVHNNEESFVFKYQIK